MLKMALYICVRCGNPFKARPSDHQKHCTRSCYLAALKAVSPKAGLFGGLICVDCKQEKPVTDFRPRLIRGEVKPCPRCEPCRVKHDAACREARREAIRRASALYIARQKAADPKGWKQRHNSIAARLYAKNPNKYRAKAAASRAANPGKVSQAMKTWRSKNPDKVLEHVNLRRARILNAPRSEMIDRAAIIARDKGKCYLCGKEPKGWHLTLDHMVPLSRGGDHTPENLRVCCRKCNNAKSDKTPEEYRDYLKARAAASVSLSDN